MTGTEYHFFGVSSKETNSKAKQFLLLKMDAVDDFQRKQFESFKN